MSDDFFDSGIPDGVWMTLEARRGWSLPNRCFSSRERRRLHYPMVVVTQRVREGVEESKLKGIMFEVVHAVHE